MKKIGIAIYLLKDEDIYEIKKKVEYYPDWIHLDLVDKTFNENAKEIDLSKGFEARNNWKDLIIMTHIMSKKPSKFIEDVSKFSDYIILHKETDENLEANLKKIRKLGKKSGISFLPNTDIDFLQKYFGLIDMVQVLGIQKPGESGQFMELNAINLINRLDELKEKYHFDLCFDGGIKISNINRINAEYIVSGSAVLKSDNIKEAIYALKTSSKYYYGFENDFKKFLKKSILETLKKIEFVQSGTLVGSFAEKEGIDGISDIDIIVIIDNINKEKFDLIIKEFEKLSKIIKSDYNYNTLINTTFGPLKFNEEKLVVFHLMIYDISGHIEHCKKSPFTCYDWQRSKEYVKKHMTQIYEITHFQPNYFFNSRRSVKDYLSDLKSRSISYREYKFINGGLKEIKKNKFMDNKDKFEFAYHIMKFCMNNFLKIYYSKNDKYEDSKLLNYYFVIFDKNKKIYSKFYLKIKEMKDSNKFKQWEKEYEEILTNFLDDFEKQFNNYFHETSRKLLFIRHEMTEMNAPNVFIGQKSDPNIIIPSDNKIKSIFEILPEQNINIVYSSSSKRCIQTINLIKKSLKIKKIIFDNNLKEIDYGDVDGKDFEYLKENYSNIIKEWSDKKDPKFPNGENTLDVNLRLKTFIKRLIKDTDKTSLIFTHNVVLRCLIGENSKVDLNEWYKLEIPYFEPIQLILTNDKKIYLNMDIEQKNKIFDRLNKG